MNNENINNNQKKKSNKAVKIFIGIVALIILILLLLSRCGTTQDNIVNDPKNIFDLTTDSNVTEIVDEDKKEIEDRLNQQMKDSNLTMSILTTVDFENGNSEGYFNMINDEKNSRPIIVQIRRADTDEVIYQSDLIPIGKSISSTKLDTNLEKGTYDCHAVFYLVNEETGAEIGKGSIPITINIKN